VSVEKIEAWETEDGQMFDNGPEAYAHEKELNTAAAVEAFWREHGYSGMSVSDVVDFCTEHRAELSQALLGHK